MIKIMVDPAFQVLLVVVLGTITVYGPIVGGSWLLRRSRLKQAWKSEPGQLSARRRWNYARLLFQEAVRAHQNADHEKAAETCRRVLRLEASDPQASRLLVASLFANGDFEEARQALERHMAANPADETAKLVPAAIYCETGNLVEAREALDSIDPQKLPKADRALWFNNYAFTLSGLEIDLDLAREYGERALELASVADRQFTLRTLGVVHLARKEAELSIDYLKSALKEKQHLRPGDVEFTNYYLAKALLLDNRVQEAKNCLRAVQRGGTTSYSEKARDLLNDVNTHPAKYSP